MTSHADAAGAAGAGGTNEGPLSRGCAQSGGTAQEWGSGAAVAAVAMGIGGGPAGSGVTEAWLNTGVAHAEGTGPGMSTACCAQRQPLVQWRNSVASVVGVDDADKVAAAMNTACGLQSTR